MKIADLHQEELKELLNELYERYNRVEFIDNDPISIPHAFTEKEDVEISGFFAAILAWGQRAQIMRSAKWLLDIMDNSPYDFVINAGSADLQRLNKFYYRTFQSVDAVFLVKALRKIYSNGGLESLFTQTFDNTGSVKDCLIMLHKVFDSVPHEIRSMKHVANVQKGSSAKRLNMFLRWMVRNDNRGVDFGLWSGIPSSALYIPLDVHTGNSARALGILQRKQSDWKSVEEITSQLRIFDSNDPVKYDFALFGAGIEGMLPR